LKDEDWDLEREPVLKDEDWDWAPLLKDEELERFSTRRES